MSIVKRLELEAQLAAVVREREEWNGKHQAACLEIERLRAALEPFSNHARQVETLHPGWYHENFEYDVGLPMKWFIAARAAYKQSQEQ
jgi:hypothetical protein